MTRVPFDFDKKKTSLGLNKRAKVKFNDKNLIDNISDYVDLGLPSGNLWCRYNVGASSETDSGDFLTLDELKTLDLPDGMAIPSKEDIEATRLLFGNLYRSVLRSFIELIIVLTEL